MNNKQEQRLSRRILVIIALLFVGWMSLWYTNYAILYMLAGPIAFEDTSGSDIGAYVKYEIDAVVGYYAAEHRQNSSAELRRYAIVPVGDRYVTFILPTAYLDAADALMSDPTASAIVISGELTPLDDSTSRMMSNWARSNGISGAWLSLYAVKVDSIAGVSKNIAVTLTAVSFICLTFAAYLIVTFGTAIRLEELKVITEQRISRTQNRAVGLKKHEIYELDEFERYLPSGRLVEIHDVPDTEIKLYGEDRTLDWYGFKIKIIGDFPDNAVGEQNND